MNWYIAKLVYRIITGEGLHAAQFDEQLVVVKASCMEEAFEKALIVGNNGTESFLNEKKQIVQWNFINVAEVIHIPELGDGTEIYSCIKEVDDAVSYEYFINRKATALNERILINS